MCITDYALARYSRSSEYIVSLNAASFTEIAGENRNRNTLIISPPDAGHIHLSIVGDNNNLEGIKLFANANPLILSRLTHGDIVSRKINGVMSAGTDSICVWFSELVLPNDVWAKVWERLLQGQ